MWLRHAHCQLYCQLSGWLYCTSLQKLAHWNLRDRKKSKLNVTSFCPGKTIDTSITRSAMLQTSSSQFQRKDQRSILLRNQNVWYEPPRIHVATGWLVPFLVAVFISKGTTQMVLQEISSWFPGASWHRDLVDIMAIATRVSFGAKTSSHQSHGPKQQTMADESETSLHFP